MGRLKKDAGTLDGQTLRDVFDEKVGKWDKSKMVRSFARLGATSNSSVTKTVTEAVSPLNQQWSSNSQRYFRKGKYQRTHSTLYRKVGG
jgi:hypothetical protein